MTTHRPSDPENQAESKFHSLPGPQTPLEAPSADEPISDTAMAWIRSQVDQSGYHPTRSLLPDTGI